MNFSAEKFDRNIGNQVLVNVAGLIPDVCVETPYAGVDNNYMCERYLQSL